jgi:hypothetical protein
MTENDKILIHAYLDGETSEDESKYIESLLKLNNEANEFANNIKRANTEINSYFNSSESKDLEIDIDAFIKKQKQKSAKPSFSFNDFFSNPRYYGFAASAFLLVIILVPTFNENRSDNSIYSISPESASFLEEILKPTSNSNEIVNELIINRGDQIEDNIHQEIKNTIASMILNNKEQGRLTYENSSLIIFINEKVLNELDYSCYSGSIFFSNSKQSNILYCASKNDSTLTYIN